MKPTNQPQVKLKGIEYLLLAIQSDPGKSQRHYLRRLYQYNHGVPSYNNGGTNNGYFTSGSYRNVLWYDSALGEQVKYECMMSINSVFRSYTSSKGSYAYKSQCSAMRLTLAGHERANKVREKLGLEPVDLTAGMNAHANQV